MIRRVVTLGGPPGGGKSTAGRRVAETLGLTYRSAGEVFRAEGQRRGLDVEAFGHYAEQHPEVDVDLDRAMQAFWRPGFLLDSRIQGPLCRRAQVPVHDLVVTASLDVRAGRVAARDGQGPAEARRRIEDREASERLRYRRQYDIDLATEVPDLVVDSSQLAPDAVVAEILDYLRTHDGAAPG